MLQFYCKIIYIDFVYNMSNYHHQNKYSEQWDSSDDESYYIDETKLNYQHDDWENSYNYNHTNSDNSDNSDNNSEYSDNSIVGCSCKMECNTQTQAQIKYQTLKHNSNYIGTSKKMAYGQYIRTTPGMETFASKKIPVLQPMINLKIRCFRRVLCKMM